MIYLGSNRETASSGHLWNCSFWYLRYKEGQIFKKKNIDLLYFTSVKHSNERKDD